MFLPTITRPLSGWGKYPVNETRLCRPEKLATLTQVARSPEGGSAIARGAGRSYGDAAVNAAGATVLMERLDRMLAFDPETGTLRCEAGVTLAEILDVFVPRGWFPSVTPGTKYITVGGAIAADVHGKNHHRDGSFARFVPQFQLLLASGETVTCSRTANSDLFWATVGGMGLTGIITEADFILQPIETAYIRQHSIKARNLDEAIALFEEYEPQYPYSVAWIDCLAKGASLGRSILMFGDRASLEDLTPQQRRDPLALHSKQPLRVPFDPPAWLLNPFTVGQFNNLYYARQGTKHARSVLHYDPFFYPLDFLRDWNRLYGKSGFVQYQCVLPPETSRAGLIELLTRCSQTGWASFLAVLKRFGEQEGWLSFPMPGYTLALDIPMRSGLGEFVAELDRLTARFGGRVYLAKDACLSPAMFRATYERFPQWLEVKRAVDPENRFRSALSDRLEIYP